MTARTASHSKRQLVGPPSARAAMFSPLRWNCGRWRMEHVEEPPRAVELEEGRAKRHQQDIGRRQPVDGQVAKGRGVSRKTRSYSSSNVVGRQHCRSAHPRVSSLRPACARPGPETRPSRDSAARRSGRYWASGWCWIRSWWDFQCSVRVSSKGTGASPRSARRWFSACNVPGVVAGQQRKDRLPFILDRCRRRSRSWSPGCPDQSPAPCSHPAPPTSPDAPPWRSCPPRP